MPELPEVETIRRQLAPRLRRRVVLEAGSHPTAKFTPAVAATGVTLLGAERRGKFLLLPTDDGREVVVHLGMTGVLAFAQPSDVAGDEPYLRAWWLLGGSPSSEAATGEAGRAGEEILRFDDVRRFGRIRVVPAGDYSSIPTLAAAGPEPFDPTFDGDAFWERLQASRRKLKTSLLSPAPGRGRRKHLRRRGPLACRDQPAGHQGGPGAGRSAPRRDPGRLLAQGIANGGTTLRDYRQADGGEGANQRSLVAYGRAGLPCLRCSTTLVSAVIDARTTTWCPLCQRR